MVDQQSFSKSSGHNFGTGTRKQTTQIEVQTERHSLTISDIGHRALPEKCVADHCYITTAGALSIFVSSSPPPLRTTLLRSDNSDN